MSKGKKTKIKQKVHPKVLVCAPTHISKDYAIRDWIHCAKNLDYPNYEIFLCDNSPTPHYSKKLSKETGVNVGWFGTRENDHYLRMAESHDKCRKKAIEIGADYMFHWEVDVFPPTKYIIQRLMRHYHPVVGACYHIKQGAESFLCLQEAIIDKETFVQYSLEGGRDLMFVDGTCKRVFHVGLGCVLIHKYVFENLPFGYQKGRKAHPDTFFSHDCYLRKIPIYADTSMICKHDNQSWEGRM